LSDFWLHGEVAKKYGVLRSEGYTERAIFLIDEEGVIRYIDIHDIDDQPSNDVLFAEIAKINPAAAKVFSSVAEDEPLPKGGVVMYCTSWCPDCKRARLWLKEHNIKYTEVDIGVNRKAAEQVRTWGGGSQTTPTFDIDGVVVVDFQVEELSKILKVG